MSWIEDTVFPPRPEQPRRQNFMERVILRPRRTPPAALPNRIEAAYLASRRHQPDEMPVVRLRGTMTALTFGDTTTTQSGWLEWRIAPDTVSVNAKCDGGPNLEVIRSDHPAVIAFLQDALALFERHAEEHV